MTSALPILTAAEIRAAEERVITAGTSVATLMARAGAVVAEVVRRFGRGAPMLVLCGPGNNGGDGYVAARLLRAAGVSVRVAALGVPRGEAAASAAAAWGDAVEPLAGCAPAPVLVDALFGTGLARALDPDVADTIHHLARAAQCRIAVDLPSGVGTDDGRLLGQIPGFDLTVALGALKPAHALLPAAGRCGQVLVGGIGLETSEAVTHRIGRPHLASPTHDATKYTRGKAVVVAGAMPGATLLTAAAAQRAGASYVELVGAAGEGPPHALVRTAWDDAKLADERIRAIAVGPGLGLGDEARRRLDRVLATEPCLVLDADALTLIGRDRHDRLRGHVITPHWGEFVRLFGDDGRDRLAQARSAAAASGAVVLLKGADTIVAHPDGRAAINPLAPAWLASAGTGDVLTGIVVALLAQGRTPFEAAQAAAWLHAQAGRLAGPALIADDLVDRLPAVVAACL